jgi:uncharacterized protein (TIGR00661 family)
MNNPAVNICFYISDYGYGHAARDIAVIRKLLKGSNANIFAKTDGPYWFISQSLPEITAIRTRNDIGLVYKENSTNLDRIVTEKSLNRWISSWDDYIQREKAFCQEKNINVILSDIVPQPFIVANDLGLPGIGISNFTWYYIFHGVFGKNEAISCLKKAYANCDMALVLPLNENMDLFKKRMHIGLVSREATIERFALRKRFGVTKDEILVYIGLGRSMDPSILSGLRDWGIPKVKFLFSSNIDPPKKCSIRIPAEETESQNYIAMCDLVVSKTGYSTVSEAIRARVPLLLFKREGFKEDTLIAETVQRLGIGDEITEQSFLNGEWFKQLDKLERYRDKFDSLESRFKRDGTSEAVAAIMDGVS